MSVKSLSTVCILLGPYRNLTSLTSSVLALHPLVSVFNHGGERVFGNQKIDFLDHYTNEKFDAFCEFALDAAKGGQKGSYGGSITLSGAFNRNEDIRNRYEELYENGKHQSPKCLIWKEPHRVLHHLRANNFSFQNLFKQNQKVRFLIPVRNIYDCACSNFLTGHYTIGYRGVRNDSDYILGTMEDRKKSLYVEDSQLKILQIIDMILADLKCIHQIQKMFPERFLFYFQHTEPKKIFTSILEFLNLGTDEHAIHSQFEIRPIKYYLDPNFREAIVSKIDSYFFDDADMHENLTKFF